MKRFPPPAADQPLLDQLRAIGVGPGLDPATDPSLSADTLRGMRDAVTGGPAAVQAELTRRYIAGFGDHNGYLLADIGHYGTDYTLRALTDRVGVGALKPKVAIYAFTQTANDLTPLTGGGRYVLHLPADQLPVPARGLLVDHPLRRRRLPVRQPVQPLPDQRPHDRSTTTRTGRSTSTCRPTSPPTRARRRTGSRRRPARSG